MLRVFYDFTILYSILLLFYYLTVLKNASNNNYLMLLCCNFVANIGDTWVIFAKTVEEALLATKVSYIGNAFMCYFMFKVILSACKVKISIWIERFIVIITLFTLASSMMIGENSLFYKSAELFHENGYSYLVKDYGPFHGFYSIVIMLYGLITFAVAVYALFTPSLVSRVMAFTLAMTEVIAILVYFGERHMGLKIDLNPFSKCIMVTLSLFVIRKLYLYDANRVSQEINELSHDNGLILFDKDKRYLGSNVVAKEIFEEINLYHVEQAILEKFKDKKFFEGILNGFEQNEEKYPGIYEKNGEIYRIKVRPLKDRRVRGAEGYVIEFQNDTKAQNYIRQINDMNVELEETAKKANAANEAKSSFLANMSHEIRTPINAVLGLNSIILRDTKEEKTREFARDIDSAGRSLLSLINDILDFSKVEAGKMDLVPVNYKTSSLISDCQNMLIGKIEDKGLSFNLVVNENLPSELYGDEIRLRQIIVNILNNAVKYTESGSITLKVDFEKLDEDLISFIVSVIDTGSGISEENQKVLFESFKRIDEKKNRNIEGTGLGLALVQKLSNMMDGGVIVESKEGEGSNFTVRVLQNVVSWEAIGQIEQSLKKSGVVNSMDALMETEGRILVVDDVKVNLKVFSHLLAKSKLEIDEAESGRNAIEKCKNKKYDIIFMDHMMPEMDGIETLHRIREDEESVNRETPVIMLTANAIEGIKEQYMHEGFDEYLSKPVNFNPLKDMIVKFL